MGFLAMANSYIMRTCLNLAIVEMVYISKNQTESVDSCPGELPHAGKLDSEVKYFFLYYI